MPGQERRILFLLQRAARAALGYANKTTYDALGVSATQFATMMYLAKHPKATMTAIASLFDLNKSGVSGMISRLERDGFVTRTADPEDARSNLVGLTPSGDAVRASTIPLIKRVTAQVTEGFSTAEMEVIYRFLNTVVERCAVGDADQD